MKNQWLTRFRVGKRVRYKGLDKELKDKEGTVVHILGPIASWSQTEWVDVLFVIPGPFPRTKQVAVEKENLEVI